MIEFASIAAASAALSSLNKLIERVNETGSGVNKLIGTISEFGESLDSFEINRRNSTFKPLTESDLLKLSQLRRQYERHWQSVNDLLLAADPELLDDFRKMKAEQEIKKKEHMAFIAKKRKQRKELMNQIAAAALTLIIGSIIIVLGFFLLFNIYG